MRILIVDDEPAVHDSYRRSFAPVVRDDALVAMATELYGDANADGGRGADHARPVFDCVHRDQGLEAVEDVRRAVAAGDPFPVAFIDIRMPPGIDGKETAQRIRAIDPDINIVIVTGYSDFSPADICKVAGPADKIFYIAKPFEVAEVVQTATALGERWIADRALRAARETLSMQVARLEEQAIELAANESRALHQAHHDALTEAPNRLAFQAALAERAGCPGLFAVAMVDLDRFKLVNDTLGHLAGDELIREICAILQRHVPANGLVARLGGDEFGLLFDSPGAEAAVMACEHVLHACAVTMKIFGHSVQGSASAGVVVAEEGDRDPVDLLRRADLALNDAKRHGRGIARRFDAEMDEGIRLRRRIEGGLGLAIERGELAMKFQPIVARERHEVVGFEALLRWHTEEHGPISPSVFIPIAEESNLIHELGDWVLDQSLAVLKQWPGQYVSVNFSPRQFRRHNFVGYVVERCQRAGIAPARLQIEVTETAIFDDVDRAADTLYRLRQMGFRIALDDFGTGYSSLYNIRTFALDALKIDRSFVEGMARERTSAAIVRSIVHLAQALGLSVIAEGVETQAQVDLLSVAGASHMQGYHFARPVDAALALELANERYLGGAGDDVMELDPATILGTGTAG